jgi:sulfur carrier protein ThiS
MPKVVVHLHTIYQMKTEQGLIRRVEYELPSDLPVSHLLKDLRITITPENTLIVVNGKIESSSYKMKPNDDIHVIPAISGGNQGISFVNGWY